ncbi:MAG: branched-chain amino acid ABC transporter permease [Firmicutes bacterium]|jgi:branched-chain amino acid transport system permease protein|nr:branched-chain amino acid ABC transporter permease [Bacillota bacterium]MDH7496552.1 branched-chain amino acid ABC transporter permease [Bacillota bacterium]
MEEMLAQLPQQVVNGLTLGSVYALLALGYSMVYGILKMLNFAHGDVLMVGAFTGWGILQLFAGSGSLTANPLIVVALMLVAAVASTGLLGGLIERFAYRPLRTSSRLAPLISALGVSIIIENVAMLLTGGRAKAYQTEMLIPPTWTIQAGGATVSATRLAIFASSIAIMLALDFAVSRTMLGKAMRAVSEDLDAAEYMGVRTSRVIAATFVMGSALAGVAGVMIGLYYMQVDFIMGFSAGLKAFTSAVLGGIGNVRGAMAGGIVLGLAESLGVLFVAPVYKDAIVFSVLIAALIAKPSGLLGERVRDRV